MKSISYVFIYFVNKNVIIMKWAGALQSNITRGRYMTNKVAIKWSKNLHHCHHRHYFLFSLNSSCYLALIFHMSIEGKPTIELPLAPCLTWKITVNQWYEVVMNENFHKLVLFFFIIIDVVLDCLENLRSIQTMDYMSVDIIVKRKSKHYMASFVD